MSHFFGSCLTVVAQTQSFRRKCIIEVTGTIQLLRGEVSVRVSQIQAVLGQPWVVRCDSGWTDWFRLLQVRFPLSLCCTLGLIHEIRVEWVFVWIVCDTILQLIISQLPFNSMGRFKNGFMNNFCDVYFYVKGQVSLYFGFKTAVLML